MQNSTFEPAHTRVSAFIVLYSSFFLDTELPVHHSTAWIIMTIDYIVRVRIVHNVHLLYIALDATVDTAHTHTPIRPALDPMMNIQQVSNARRRLQRALAHVTGPILDLVGKGQRRDRLRLVCTLATTVTEALATEGMLEDDLSAGRYTEAVARAGEELGQREGGRGGGGKGEANAFVDCLRRSDR